MPVRVTNAPNTMTLIKPTTAWQTTTVQLGSAADFKVDQNFYVTARVAGR